MTQPDAHKGVLFDLDGTLIDTAPDMVAVLEALQADHGSPVVDYALARSNVSNGAAGLIRLAFPDVPTDQGDQLLAQYLQRYQQALCHKSQLFPGIPELLDRLEQGGVPWGVVTNKPQRLTEPLLARLGLARRYACAISGDTLPQRKPDPAPMYLASRMLGVEPAEMLYVGDARRDIDAGKAAGMTTIAAGWGYITANDDAAAWQADHVARDTTELAQIVLNAVLLTP